MGTRPEIIKMAPIIRECQQRKLHYFVIHSGQHYSYQLDKVFFEELQLPRPKYNLEVGSGTHGEQTARLLERIEQVLIKAKPNLVLVEGDTNTVMAGALAASKLDIKVGHVEAGLRSYDRSMPEELNRLITDHLSDYLFAPTRDTAKILAKEGIDRKKIFNTGNTIVDSVFENLKLARKKSTLIKNLNLKIKNYLLLTMHRQENTDNYARLLGIIQGLKLLSDQYNIPIIYPIHPRARKMLTHFTLVEQIKQIKNLKIIEPVGFLDFLALEDQAKLILTDSGGVQEESCILKVPCVTLRDNTERPETLQVGSNILAGTDPQKILQSVNKMIEIKTNWKNPFGSGKSAAKIINIIYQEIQYD